MKIVSHFSHWAEATRKIAIIKKNLLHADCHFIVLLIYLKEPLNYVSACLCGEGVVYIYHRCQADSVLYLN